MKQLKETFVESARELKNIRSLTGLALLMALGSILSAVLTIQITPSQKIGFGYLATVLMGALYGPVAGGVAAGLRDILQYLIKPTGMYYFGFTLNAILGAMIYGLFFYKRRVTVVKAAVSKGLVNVFVNSVLGSIWLADLLGKGVGVLFYPKLVENLISLPVEAAVLYLALGVLLEAYRKVRLGSRPGV